MSTLLKKLLPVLLPAVAVLAATTQVAPDRPIVNFRLPTFNPAGFRQWLVRGSEARIHDRNDIAINGLTLTVFSGNAADRIETMLLSPVARVAPEDQVISGPGTIRVIDDEFEASGSDWRYAHQDRFISINQNVRVTFRAELKNLLQ